MTDQIRINDQLFVTEKETVLSTVSSPAKLITNRGNIPVRLLSEGKALELKPGDSTTVRGETIMRTIEGTTTITIIEL